MRIQVPVWGCGGGGPLKLLSRLDGYMFADRPTARAGYIHLGSWSKKAIWKRQSRTGSTDSWRVSGWRYLSRLPHVWDVRTWPFSSLGQTTGRGWSTMHASSRSGIPSREPWSKLLGERHVRHSSAAIRQDFLRWSDLQNVRAGAFGARRVNQRCIFQTTPPADREEQKECSIPRWHYRRVAVPGRSQAARGLLLVEGAISA